MKGLWQCSHKCDIIWWTALRIYSPPPPPLLGGFATQWWAKKSIQKIFAYNEINGRRGRAFKMILPDWEKNFWPGPWPCQLIQGKRKLASKSGAITHAQFRDQFPSLHLSFYFCIFEPIKMFKGSFQPVLKKAGKFPTKCMNRAITSLFLIEWAIIQCIGFFPFNRFFLKPLKNRLITSRLVRSQLQQEDNNCPFIARKISPIQSRNSKFFSFNANFLRVFREFFGVREYHKN